MLKYCEQYRNMRESLCREHTKTDYCRGNTEAVLPHSKRQLQITSLTCDEFPAQTATKSSSLTKDGIVQSKSDERDCIERHYRRPSVNFEKEFTFAPRLNLASVRMAKERTGKARESIERRANALVAEVQMKFTFKPKVSSRSEKIAQGLKTSFLERQLIHVERQKKMLVSQKIISISQGNQGRIIPAIRPHKQKKSINSEKSKSERLAQADCKANDEIPKTESTRSAPDHKAPGGSLGDSVVPDNSSATGQPVNDSVSPHQPEHQNRRSLRRHQRLKTHPGASNDKDGVLQEDVMKPSKLATKPKEGHKKAASVSGQVTRGAQYYNMPTFKKLRNTKDMAENAMKSRKIFVCHGPYPVVRASLRKRGWVEKHFKGCPAVVTEGNKKAQEKSSSSDNEDDDGGADVTDKGGKTDNGGKEDNDGDESTDSTVWSAGYEGEDCEYSLLSRFCRNATASFFWTCRRDDIDFKYLRKDQIANHFSKAYSFTTKVGLCTHLRNLAWFEDSSSDDFFPRCHRLGSDDEREAFIDDYRVTSACNILKLLINRSNDQSRTSTDLTAKAKSSITLRTIVGSSSRTSQRSPSCSASSQRSRSSLASGERRSMIGQMVPSRAILLALRACRQFLMCRNNEDIDGLYENAMLTDEEWDSLIAYYYQIIHYAGTMEGGEEYIGRCKEMLKEMRELLPQLDLDGFRNVWIVKPGAKSRGRGIMCMDRLEDILKLVSSTVKKENRWIVQKYIESPLLIYNTKFDIRQWFLVTDWNPLTLWFYKDCYCRFCSQEFTLDNFEPCIHLANNSIQKHYQNGVRDERLPENNMWSSDDFRDYLKQRGEGKLWEDVIYPGMRQAIVYTLESCQLSVEARKNSFELYGADFMLTEDYRPWLIEINSSPAMGASTTVTRKLCAKVIEDTMKVVLDRRGDKNCDTGRFELAFKQPYVDAPPYIGINLAVNGKAVFSPNLSFRRQPSANRIERLARPREKNPPKCNEYDTAKPEDDAMTTEHDSVNSKHEANEAEKSPEKSDNVTEKSENDMKGNRTHKDESKAKDVTGILKVRENNLTLHYNEKTEMLLSNARQSRNIVLAAHSNDLPKRWKSVSHVDTEKKLETGRARPLQTLSMDSKSIKPMAKKTSENKFFTKTKNPGKEIKKLKISREEHVENNGSHVNRNKNHAKKGIGHVEKARSAPGVISKPENRTSTTILRYTDRRYGLSRTVAIDIGPQQVQKNTVVIN